MTYVVALAQPGTNAIIAETQITRDINRRSVSLKSGKLFDRCIYATIGDVKGTTDLVATLRKIEQTSNEEPQALWRTVEQCLNDYDFSEAEGDFQLLLSTRALGTPRFCLFNTKSQPRFQYLNLESCLVSPDVGPPDESLLLTNKTDPPVIGFDEEKFFCFRRLLTDLERGFDRGKPAEMCLWKFGSDDEDSDDPSAEKSLLTARLSGAEHALLVDPGPSLIQQAEAARRVLTEEKLLTAAETRYLTPYLLSLWLSEITLGKNGETTTWKYRAGGPFHFVYQTTDTEGRQQPALYSLDKADSVVPRTYRSWHRVAVVDYGLNIEGQTFAKHEVGKQEFESYRIVVQDEVSMRDLEKNPDPSNERQHSIEAELGTLPFVRFCGFGNYYNDDREDVCFLVTPTMERSEFIDANNQIRPDLYERLCGTKSS